MRLFEGLLMATLGSAELIEPRAYIYIILARGNGTCVFYVGQTNQRNGSLGRLVEHISRNDQGTAWETV